MALSRKFLTAMGIEAEKVDEIITAHTETVDALKEERDKYKVDAEKLPSVQEELESLKKASAQNDGKNPFEVKYNAIKEEFEQFKADIEAKNAQKAKEDAYKALLVEAGVSEKRIDSIIRVSDAEIEKLELDKDGKAKNAGDVKKAIETDWADFIVKEGVTGAGVSTPPEKSGGTTMTKDEILAIKDTSERQKAMAENHELFGF